MKKLHFLFIACLLFCLTGYAQLTNYRNLNGSPDGAFPQGDITVSGNLMFGATTAQGANAGTLGTLFSVHTDGTNYKVIHNFTGGSSDGSTPSYGAMVASNGKLYGTAQYEGANGSGIIFSIDTNGNNFTILHSFGATSNDGLYPAGQPTLVNGVLFGLTSSDGVNGYGTVYSINTNGGNYQTRVSYDAYGINGDNPLGELIYPGSGTVFYGMTTQGGASGFGNIFSFDSAANTISDLHDFNGTDGSFPAGDLTYLGGLYYGMTEVAGGSGFGNIFSFNPSGNVVISLYTFSGPDGAYPGGNLTPSGSLLYGMTQNGGPYNGGNGNSYGNIFSFNPTGNTVTTQINFNNTAVAYGNNPEGSLTLSGSTFYGLTKQGGNGNGVVFKFIPAPCNLTTIASITSNVSCHGGNNGNAIVTPANGRAPYNYSWSNGTSTVSTSNPAGAILPAGGYTVTITDANSCSATASILITQPLTLADGRPHLNSNVLCNGGFGSAQAYLPTGGKSPYTYAWNGGTTSTNPTNASLLAGTYYVNVTDANGCTGTSNGTITVTQPNILAANASVTANVTCHGNSTGSAQSAPSGGVAPYTYSWSSGATASGISGKAAGTYSLIVHDNHGCTAIGSVIISQPIPISATTSVNSNVTCNGFSTGSAQVSPGGGTPPYTYAWQGGMTTASVSNLSAGTYTVNVSDNCGANVNVSATLTQPNALSVTTSVIANVTTCSSSTNGSARSTPSGGTSPYTYSWAPTGGTNQTVSSIGIGTYTITVSDNCEATATASVTITGPAAIAVSVASQTNVSCGGGNNGTASVSVHGGNQFLNTNTGMGTYIGNGVVGYTGDGGPATAAEVNINDPFSFVNDASGNVYFADAGNNVIRKVNTSGIITTVIGTGVAGYTGDGGPASACELYSPRYLAVDASGNLFFSDLQNRVVRKVNTSGIISTFAGNGIGGFSGNGGPASAAELNAPQGVIVDPAGNVYIADNQNAVIRKVNTSGIINTIAGNGVQGYSGDGGSALSAEIGIVIGLAMDNSGNLAFQTWTGANWLGEVRKVSSSGIISTVVGPGTQLSLFNAPTDYSGNGGPATAATMAESFSLAYDQSGNLYFADTYNNVIRKVNTSGTISVVAGNAYGAVDNTPSLNTIYTGGFSGDGGPATAAELYEPDAVGFDNTGSLLIGDQLNDRVRKFMPFGTPNGYHYSWAPNGGTKATASNLSAGTYTVTVTDSAGCTGTVAVTISQPGGLSSIIAVSTGTIYCVGNSTGSAQATAPIGGTPPYTYNWSPNGGTNLIATGLSPGTYTITGTDANGCTTNGTVTITQPPAILPNSSVTNVAGCYGNSNGSAQVAPTNGTAPYTYSWSSGETNSSISSKVADTYSIVISDSHGCSNTSTVTISQPAILLANASVVANVSGCNGSNNGSAQSAPAGGTSPYTYTWSSGETISAIGGKTAGLYSVTVHDNLGCTATASVTITQPAVVAITIASQTNISCNGNSNGSATANAATGGNGTPIITRFAGNGTTTDATNVLATAAGFGVDWSGGMVFDKAGNLYFPDDNNNVINKITPAGIITQVVGTVTNASGGYSGDGGPATAAEMREPHGITFDTVGNMYIAEAGNNIIRKVNTSGIISTIAGDNFDIWQGGFSGDGGPATNAELHHPVGIAVDKLGNVLIADQYNSRIRKISTSGTITTIAGDLGPYGGFAGDGGQATNAELDLPEEITLDATGNLFITDYQNSVIRKVNTSGIISTVVGFGPYTGYSGDGGQATAAELNSPNSVALDGFGNLYIADASNNRIRKVNTSGVISTIAGSGAYGYSGDGGSAMSAELSSPQGVVVDNANNVYIIDGGFPAYIRKISPNGSNNFVYTYNWSPSGGTNLTASNLSAGTYTVTATDYIGCTGTASVNITQPAAFIANINSTNINCFGNNNGSAQSTPSGGSSPYTYAWQGGATTSGINNLSAGTYTVSVSDNCGNSQTATINITQPSSPIAANASVTANNTACSNNIGSAQSSPSGGTTPFTYSWSSGAITSSISNKSSGTYTITVSDKNGCSATGSVTITQPSGSLAINASVTSHELCNGGNIGSAQSAPSGGSSPYTFLWSSGETASSISGKTAATFTVTVHDNGGCSASGTVTVTQPSAVLANTSVTANVSCNGNSNGTAQSSPSNGLSPYAFTWSSGETTSSISGKSVGTYTLSIHDNNGCSSTGSVTITQPAVLTANASVTANVSCNGSSTGTAQVVAAGGTSPYTYSWSSGNSTTTITGKSAGTYSITVTDIHGCNITTSITITQPASLAANASVTSNLHCNGASTGSAQTAPSGGTTPYTYTWQGGATTSSITGKSAGTYTITVKDHCAASATASVIITQPAVLTSNVSVVTNVSCYLAGNGSAQSNPTTGTSPYTFAWSSGETISSISNKGPGTYTISVHDNCGASATGTATITQPAVLHDSVSLLSNVGCYGGNGGKMSIGSRGGNLPYTYLWAPSGNTTYTQSNLTAGAYTVTVTDRVGCSYSIIGTVTQPAAPLSSTIPTPTCVGGGKGTVTITPAGGSSPYVFLWSNSSTTTSITVASATYTVKVSDSHGCNATNSVTFSCGPQALGRVELTSPDAPPACCLAKDEINLYPNPNKGTFTLTGLTQGMLIEMYDYTGRKVTSISVNDNTLQLNIYDQPNGVYLLRILSKEGILVGQKKVVKTN